MSIIPKWSKRIFDSLMYRLGLSQMQNQIIQIQNQHQSLQRIEEKINFLINATVQLPTEDPRPLLRGNNSVVFISDQKYLYATMIAISSIYFHSAQSVGSVFLIATEDCERLIPKIKECYPDLHIIIQEKPDNKDMSFCHVSSTARLKYDLPEILQNLDKVLYLDSDILVQEDLAPLFATDINNYDLAAVSDVCTIYENYPGIYYCSCAADYINSGVLFMNLKQMRNDKATERLHRWKKTDDNLHFVDQDAINQIFSGSIKQLPLKYNVVYGGMIQRNIPREFAKKIFKCGINEISNAMIHPALIHFAGYPKPWNSMNSYGYTFWLTEEINFKRIYDNFPK